MDHTTSTTSLFRAPAFALGIAGLTLAAIVGAPLVATAAELAPDTIAPDSTVHAGTAPASGWYRASQPVRITATDEGDGVASISYVIGDSAPVTTPGADVSLTVAGEGVVALTYWATDLAGNDEPTTTRFFSIDTVAPEIDVTTPTLVEQGGSVAFDYACRDTASGVASCTAPLAPGALLPTDALGEQTIDIVATDAAGWSTTRTFRYLVAPDLTAPGVSVATAPIPASGWFTTGIGVGVVADDASGIRSYHWSTDGAVSMGGDSDGVETDPIFTIDVDGVTDVRVWAYDAHGNRGDAAARVRIDTVAPTVTVGGELPAFAAPAYRVGERVVIRAVCDDATSGIASCGIVEVPSGVVPTDAVGDHTLTLVGTDVAGNRTETAYAYRVLAPVAEPGGGSGGGSDGGAGGASGGPHAPTSAGGGDPLLASTGVDVTGLVLIGGLLAGAGAAALGMRRALRR